MADIKALTIKLNNFQNELRDVDQQLSQLKTRRKDLLNEISLVEGLIESLSQPDQRDKFNADSYVWSAEAQRILETVFKLKQFRSHQLAAINATLSGYDVLLIMPTGGGKSLCFQLPALIDKGLTLVVSPLISLMEDQLNQLNELGIATEILSSNTDRSDSSRILSAIGQKGEIPFRMLYVTPEKVAKSKRLMAQLEKCYQNKNFKRLVIDEVHCCSSWGHDFRPDYQFLGIMRNQFPETPILGLTATATPAVICDVQKILNIKGCFVFKDSFYRPNLRYHIQRVEAKKIMEKIMVLLRERYRGQSGLIYCLTIKDVEEVTEKLRTGGIQALPYHAQLTPQQRTRTYQKWFNNQVQLIVATVAFGMGINKNDLRFVFHYSMSKSFENYYQETGRAGRDGLPADCILFYRFVDIFRATTMVFSERNGLRNVYAMLAYCINRQTCRKEQIANYFGDVWNQKCEETCDNCLQPLKCVSVDVSQDMMELSKILAHAARNDKRLTALKLLELWSGKGEKKLRPEDLRPTKRDWDEAQDIVAHLLVNQYLKEEFHFTPYATISYIAVGPSWRPGTAVEIPLVATKKRSLEDDKERGGSGSSKSKTKSKSETKTSSELIQLID